MKKIGLYGGTFDPFHEGHLWVVEQSIKQCKLDRVYVIPNYISPFKTNKKNLLSDEERINSIHLAISRSKYAKKINIIKSDLVKGRLLKKPIYTIDTLKEFILFTSFSDSREFYTIMGADCFFNLHKYKEWESIFLLSKVIVAPREPFTNLRHEKMVHYFSRSFFLKGNSPNISSTEIRKELKNGK